MTEHPGGPGEALRALFSPAGKANPYPLYEALREYGPMLQLGPQLVLLGYQECARALREPSLLSTDAAVQRQLNPEVLGHSSWVWLTRNMLFSNAPDHDRLRRFFGGTLTPRSIAVMQPVIEAIVEDLLDELAEAGRAGAVDFMAEFAFRLPMAVMGELLGIPPADQRNFREVIGAITLAFEPIMDHRVLEPSDRGMDLPAEYFAGLIDRRRAVPGTDLLSTLVATRDRTGELTEQELIANFMLLLVAGTEAPMDLIGNAARLAIDHPEHGRKLSAEPERAAGFVAETLRFDPAAQALNRVAATDLDFFGMPLAAGAKVTLLVAAGNRDPRRFTEPSVFDPDRPNNQSLTFSGGAHYCLGAALATLQAEVALPRLLRRFPEMSLAGDPTYRDQLVQRGYDRLMVTLG